MKKFLSFVLAFALLLSLCCTGTAFAEEQKPALISAGEDEVKAEEVEGQESVSVTESAVVAGPVETVTTEKEENTEADPAKAPEEAEPEKEESAEEEPVEEAGEAQFADWNADAPALKALTEYVETVTDEASPDFIPVADRIAVFDMDGTLYGELFPTYLEYYMLAWRILKDPTIEPDAEMLALGRELRESVIKHSFASDMPIRHATQAARAYAGMTLAEFADFVTGILVREVDGFEGMTYGTAFYQPMLEVIDYLQENDFEVYVVSGSDRFICRTLLEGMIDIPYANIIGMDVGYEATGQGDTDGLDYVFKAGDQVVRTDKLLLKNLKMNKVLNIVQEIGQKPVLSFGNSSGDVSMHMYTISDNPYKSEAFMLIADDETRDYGNEEKVQKLRKEWEADGFQVISMKNDFRTIYGDNVVKTGSFRWAEEMQEDRIAVENSPEWVAALGKEQNAEQLFVVAGVGGTTATVSMHEKDAKGNWKQIMTTPGFIGKNGLGKEQEGDGKTPVGIFHFNRAFGIAEDPGCALDYHQVSEDDYWSGDQRKDFQYNKLVSIKDLPELDTQESEHIVDYPTHYQYCLNISYNEHGTPGLGSAIFLHCFDPEKPYTGGCVAIPKEQMVTVMQRVRPDCVVVIDDLANLSYDTWFDWGLFDVDQSGRPELQPGYGEGPCFYDFEEWGPYPYSDFDMDWQAFLMGGLNPPAPKAEENAAEPKAEEDAAEPKAEENAAEPKETAEEAPEVEIDYGNSALFSKEEMDEALKLVMKEFDSWEGCQLHSVQYAGDDCNSEKNLQWLNSLVDNGSFTQCIEFISSFHSPVKGGGAWKTDAEYTGWQWWLARNGWGDWTLVTWGY